MPDLMTASGRAAMLKSLTPNIAKLEKTLARQSQPLLKTLKGVDGPTMAKIGGGVAAFAAIFFAAQSLLTGKKTSDEPTKASKPAAKRTARARPAAARRKSAARARKAAAKS